MRSVLLLHLAAAALAVPALTAPVSADPAGEETLLLRGDKVYIRPNEVLEGGAVLVRDGLIVAVGKDLKAPEGAKELKGKVICAGFIDPWSVFGLEADAANDERTSASTRTLDGIDPYMEPRLKREVLRSGVTAYRLQAGSNARVAGIGALVRNHPAAKLAECTLSADACVAVSVGLSRGGRPQDPFERIGELDRLIGSLSEALSYLQDKIEYGYELQAWEKTMAEKDKELEEGFKKAKKDREKEEADAKEKNKEFKEKAYKEDRKPKPPRYDEDKEILARVVNGELPLVVEAHRYAELRGLLEGTRAFDRLRLLIAGGSESLPFAEELARRGIPVIVWPTPLGKSLDSGEPRRQEFRRHDLGLAGRLEAAGVQVLIGSGGLFPSTTRELPLLAGLAVGHGLSREAALAALTTRAAELLDVGDRVGSIAPGKDADLIVLDGEPLETSSRVRYAIVHGELVLTPED